MNRSAIGESSERTTAATLPRQGQPLGAEPGRAQMVFDDARRHSGRVRRLKILLPVLALVMVAGFLGKSWLSAPEGVSVNLAGTAIRDGRLVMADPKLDGFTRDNRAYTMKAARAIQDIGDASRIDLEGIDARLPFEDKNWITVAAASGVYDRDANRLDLDDDITVVTDNGVKALLKSARVDIAAGHIDTAEPVDITLEGASISADSMAIRDNGKVMIFERRVRMEIDAKRMQTAASAGASAGETTNEN